MNCYRNLIKSKAVRCTIAITAVLMCYAVLLGLDSSNDTFSIVGGIVGAISSVGQFSANFDF